MRTKHTPGPWKIRASTCVGTDNQLVAVVYPPETENPIEFEANNHLVAAAPDLLETLQALVDYHATDYDEIPEVKQARAAIAKAKGESLPAESEDGQS